MIYEMSTGIVFQAQVNQVFAMNEIIIKKLPSTFTVLTYYLLHY